MTVYTTFSLILNPEKGVERGGRCSKCSSLTLRIPKRELKGSKVKWSLKVTITRNPEKGVESEHIRYSKITEGSRIPKRELKGIKYL